MKLSQCDREQEVLDAVRSGGWGSAWGENIRQHVAECPVCAEVALVARELQHESSLAQTELQQAGAGLPPAGLVWWKTQRAARRAAEQRAAEPIKLVTRAAFTLGAFAALVVAVWQWPRIAAWLNGLPTSVTILHPTKWFEYAPAIDGLNRLAPAWASQTPVSLLVAGAVASFSFVLLSAYVVWREE